jgi:hypothetical protein
VRSLIPGGTLGCSDRIVLTGVRNGLFAAFDTYENDFVDTNVIAGGMPLLARGSKSAKLALAYWSFNDKGDGELSRVDMLRFLRSSLTALVCLNANPAIGVKLFVIEAGEARKAADLRKRA